MKKHANNDNQLTLNAVLHQVPHGGALHTVSLADIGKHWGNDRHLWFHSWCVEGKAAQYGTRARYLMFMHDRRAEHLARFPITVTIFSEAERANLNPKRKCSRCNCLLARVQTWPREHMDKAS